MATTTQPNTVSSEAASGGESLSSQLFEILSRQISLARSGKLDEVLTLADETDQLLSRADLKQIESVWTKGPIKDLYDELRLILCAAKREAADELEGVRKGKTSLRAYKSASRRQ